MDVMGMLRKGPSVLAGVILGLVMFSSRIDALPSGPAKIAFVYGGKEPNQIYVMNEDGSNVTQLTHLISPPDLGSGGGARGAPAFSPDGHRIAFFAIEGYPVPGEQIYVMNADGSNMTRVTSPPGENWDPAFSPDGHRIAFDSDYGMYYKQIYLMNLDGSHVTRLTNLRYGSIHPAFSADGHKIAFVSYHDNAGHSQISVMNADGSNITRLTNPQGEGVDQDPAFSPDGRKIAFTCNSQICVMNADGSDLTPLTYGRGPAFSPDGRRIAFVCDPQICVMNADGSNMIRLTNLPGRCMQPAFGP